MTGSNESHRRLPGPGVRVLIAMAAGALLGAALGSRILVIEPIGDLFIRLLVLAAVPLVFFNLLAGLTTLTDLRTFGRLSIRILGYFAVTTVIAVGAGMAVLVLVRPGAGMTVSAPVDAEVGAVPTLTSILVGLVPANVFAAFAAGDVAQLIVVAVMVGIATMLLPVDPRDRLRTLYADVAQLFRRLVDFVLVIAPLGIGALMAVAVGRWGALLVGPMAVFIACVLAAQLSMFLLYMIAVRALGGRAPLPFLRATWPVWATTISTTSSLAALPVALETAESMKLPRSIHAFALPLGAQINKDGTAIFLVAVVLFTAQAAGVRLATGEVLTAALLASLLSAASGGIPGGGFVVALMLVRALGLPLDIAAIVGGIYRLLDMGNTTLNVMGDMVGTVIITAWEERTNGTERAA